MDYKPLHFISESIEVTFNQPPSLEKVPGCPDGFTWRGEKFQIVELLSEWQSYKRTGRMAKNMRPTHLQTAISRGSWGVGEIYFRVRTADERIFDIYYDRAPKGSDQRKGSWHLERELAEE